MNFEVKKLINDLTSDIIKDYEIKIPITDINNVIRKLGGYIEINYFVSEYYDAILEKCNDNEFKITIPNITSEKRKNYVVAKELGHLFLHMGYQIDKDLWKVQGKRSRYFGKLIEQANAFGMALLMPRYEYKCMIDINSKGDKVNIAEVAKYFNVLQNIAIERGFFLGLIDR
jgi:Zn-dependent peptidase ImmA (M78 family)